MSKKAIKAQAAVFLLGVVALFIIFAVMRPALPSDAAPAFVVPAEYADDFFARKRACEDLVEQTKGTVSKDDSIACSEKAHAEIPSFQ